MLKSVAFFLLIITFLAVSHQKAESKVVGGKLDLGRPKLCLTCCGPPPCCHCCGDFMCHLTSTTRKPPTITTPKYCLHCCGLPPCCSCCNDILCKIKKATVKPPVPTKKPPLCLWCCGPPPCCNYCGLFPESKKK